MTNADRSTKAAHAQRVAAGKASGAARWGGRGSSAQIRVDPDAAAALARVPLTDRRRVASDAIRSAAADYTGRT